MKATRYSSSLRDPEPGADLCNTVERTEASQAPSDTLLVRSCLDGSHEAWCTLIDKYRKLIFSIPVKHGFSPEDSAEIFQEVCLTLLRELPRIREPQTLAAWLIKVTAHKCCRWRSSEARYTAIAAEDNGSTAVQQPPQLMLDEVEREQALREVLGALMGRCRNLIRMLFFATPAVPYEEVARRLGVAKGSIGFLRMRCLKRLRCQLEEKGFGW